MDALFSVQGRRDPQAVLRSSSIPGNQVRVLARGAAHDGSPLRPLPRPQDTKFQLLSRFMPRRPSERHTLVRRRFSGIYTARRVDRYRDVIAARCSTLLDAMVAVTWWRCLRRHCRSR
jgi:pimeloyl-[acyl-carrier protein] synthase